MEVKRKVFVKNRLGIIIVKCCASCKHHLSDGDRKFRKCTKFGIRRPKDFLCDDGWELSEGLEKAGMGGGDVKSQQYFRYINKHGLHRADEYEQMYGSRYIVKSKKK